jgi:hypothetical protein
MKKWRGATVITLWVVTQAIRPATGSERSRGQADADTRLLRKVTLHEKGTALSDFCAELQKQTGVELTASRRVADEKVTIFEEERSAREVMREVARLFGFFWLRSGHEGAYRYELDQDLRSQLAEEELRNRDLHAALLALDAEMQRYRPYVDKSFEELQKLMSAYGNVHFKQMREPDKTKYLSLFDMLIGGAWGGVQLYFHLTPADRAALESGRDLIFRPDAPNPDRRLTAEWNRTMLQTCTGNVDVNGRSTPMAEVPGIKVSQILVRLDRSELGQVSLHARWAVVWPGAGSGGQKELATGRSPSLANPENASADAALRGRPPFDRVISFDPKPSCPAIKTPRPADLDLNLDRASFNLDRSQPYAFSSDVWEAIHRATGLPIVADFYTHLYPVGKLIVDRRPLFQALCAVGDTLGVRWTKDGGYVLCRSTSYYWDKLREVPNRYLRRWARDRDENGGLPFTDFLEMATMSDPQLDSAPVAEGIEHYWGLREWAHLGGSSNLWDRQHARLLARLTPEHLNRTLQPGGIPFKELAPAEQQGVIQLHFLEFQTMEREGNPAARPASAEEFAHVELDAHYIPAGWYVARVRPASPPGQPWPNPINYVGGRTGAEAAAAAHRLFPDSTPQEVRRAWDGYYSTGIRFVFGNPSPGG